MQQCSGIAALSLDRVALTAGTAASASSSDGETPTIFPAMACMCSPVGVWSITGVLTGPVSVWRDPLYACHVSLLLDPVPGTMARMCYRALKPSKRTWMGLLLTIHVQGKSKQWCTKVPPSWVVLSAPGELSCFPNLLCLVSLLLFVQKLFNWLTVVSQEELLWM